MIFALALAAAEPLAEGTNRHFQHTVETPASPEVIWQHWTDVDTWPSWDTEVEQVVLEGEIGLGVRGVLTADGRDSRLEITAWEPMVSYAFTTRLPLGSLVVTRTLEPTESGTRFTHDVAFRGFGGWLLAPLLGKRFRRALPQVMGELAALAEQERCLPTTGPDAGCDDDGTLVP